MEDFRKKKNWWQKLLIKTGLWLLRTAGQKPILHESKEIVRARRKSYLPELEELGYTVERKTEYQFRINGVLDIYPTNAKFHNIKTGKRGSFAGQNLATFVRRYLGEI